MIALFRPALTSDPQVFSIYGGVHGSVILRLAFSQTPSDGTATLEGQRPGSYGWNMIASAIPVSSGPLEFIADGGYTVFRLTFSGLIGGASPTLSIVENPTSAPPSDLLTDGGFGKSRRVRVDPGQTGFFAGRFFRSYIEATIPVAGPSVQFRFTSPVDFILWSQSLELTQGAVELRVFTGATPSGTWVQRPIIGVNRMQERPQPYYVPLSTLETGGNFTGGTEVDLLKVRTSSANNGAQNVGVNFGERGLPAGTYYGRLQTLTGGVTVNDAAQLVYSITFEERAP